jgi:hypothetical protein
VAELYMLACMQPCILEGARCFGIFSGVGEAGRSAQWP